MGFAWEEFPNSDYYDSDLREVLAYLRKISNYLKSLDDIIEELREGLSHLNEMQDDIDSLNAWRPLVNEELAKISEDISDVQTHLHRHDLAIEEIDHRIRLIEINLEGVYQYINDKVDEIYAQINFDFNVLLNKLNQAKATLQAEIDELFERINTIDTDVYNSWIGRRVSIQENNDYTYNHLADECPTANDYRGLNLTAEEYADLNLTANDYCEYGRKKLHLDWVISPVMGFKQEINNVLTSIVNWLVNTMTATQYASLDLSADDYAALDLTSEEYFRYNPLTESGYVMVTPTGTGLSAEQYAHTTLS